MNEGVWRDVELNFKASVTETADLPSVTLKYYSIETFNKLMQMCETCQYGNNGTLNYVP
jgi:hypothetical protein